MNTYPEMNEEIKKLLTLSGKNYELYALQRITELEQQVVEQRKEIEEIDESLHIARVGRRDLAAYVKKLKLENERLEKQLENAIFTDTNIKPKPYKTFDID